MVKIGLISDVHAEPGPLDEALQIFQQEAVDYILCAGDIAGYGTDLQSTVTKISHSGCLAILGNHDLWHLGHKETESQFISSIDRYLGSLYKVVELSLEGKTLLMVHASPPDSLLEGIRLLDQNGGLIKEEVQQWEEYLMDASYDVLVVGHTHQVFAERLGRVLVVNPGSTFFNHTCAILTLPNMEVRFIALSGEKPLLTWRWDRDAF